MDTSPQRERLPKTGGRLGMVLLVATVLVGCESQTSQTSSSPPEIDVTAVDYAFAVADSVPSGWVTFRMTNRGKEIHNFQLYRLPEGRTFSEFRKARIAPMDSIWRLVWQGAVDSSQVSEVEQTIPDWTDPGSLPPDGGGAILSPGHTGQSTMKLEPGHHVMVCPLADSSGREHYRLGMIRGLVVSEHSSGASPPEADVTMRTAAGELTIEGEFKTGEQTVALHVGSPPAGSDVAHRHAILRRMDAESGSPDTVRARLGGPENVPQGETGYATIEMEPGRYTWRFFHPAKENLTHSFTVK